MAFDTQSKKEFKEFASLYFEFKDSLEDNEKMLEDLKNMTEMDFVDCEEILVEAKSYESKQNYAKFEILSPYEKSGVINTLVDRIDIIMTLSTKLNLAKDRARLIEKDKKLNKGVNIKKIQQKIRRQSLVDTLTELTSPKKLVKKQTQPDRASERDLFNQSCIVLPSVIDWQQTFEYTDKKKLIKYSDFVSTNEKTDNEDPMTPVKPASATIRVRKKLNYSMTAQDLDRMRECELSATKKVIDTKRKMLQTHKREQENSICKRSELMHCNLRTQLEIDDEKDKLLKEFPRLLKNLKKGNDLQSVAQAPSQIEVRTASDAYEKYFGQNGKLKSDNEYCKKLSECYRPFKGMSVGEKESLGMSKAFLEDQDNEKRVLKEQHSDTEIFSEKIRTYLDDLKEFVCEL